MKKALLPYVEKAPLLLAHSFYHRWKTLSTVGDWEKTPKNSWFPPGNEWKLPMISMTYGKFQFVGLLGTLHQYVPGFSVLGAAPQTATALIVPFGPVHGLICHWMPYRSLPWHPPFYPVMTVPFRLKKRSPQWLHPTVLHQDSPVTDHTGKSL